MPELRPMSDKVVVHLSTASSTLLREQSNVPTALEMSIKQVIKKLQSYRLSHKERQG